MGSIVRIAGDVQATILRRSREIACSAAGVIVGLLFAVNNGWAGGDIDTLRLATVFVGSILGASLGIIGSRALSTENDRRDRRRSSYKDYLTVQTAVRALIDFQDAISSIGNNAGDTTQEKVSAVTVSQRARFVGAIVSVTSVDFSDPPKFEDLIETDDEHAKVHRIRYYFTAADLMFRQLKDIDLFQFQAERLMVDYLREPAVINLDDYKRELLKAGAFVRSKLGIT